MKLWQVASNKRQKLLPVGEVVGIIQRASQDMVVSITDEDTKALQGRQLTTRSVSCTHTHSNVGPALLHVTTRGVHCLQPGPCIYQCVLHLSSMKKNGSSLLFIYDTVISCIAACRPTGPGCRCCLNSAGCEPLKGTLSHPLPLATQLSGCLLTVCVHPGGSDMCTHRPAAAKSQGAQQSAGAVIGQALRGALHWLGANFPVPLSPCCAGVGTHE